MCRDRFKPYPADGSRRATWIKATESLDEAIRWAQAAKSQRQALSIGLLGNAAELLPKMVQLGFTPDLVTDQTSSHDPMWGYVPIARADEDLNALRTQQPDIYKERVQASIAQACSSDY